MHYCVAVCHANPLPKDDGLAENTIAYLIKDYEYSDWDWFTVGGRWHGVMHPEDTCKVSDVPRKFVPFAVVVDGRWIEKDYDMSDKKWEKMFRQELERHPDWYVTCVDCHN